jgi:hypothetical protein
MYKFKIIEKRSKEKPSYFILKMKNLFWWEKVEVYSWHSDPYIFHDIEEGIKRIDNYRGELVKIITKK